MEFHETHERIFHIPSIITRPNVLPARQRFYSIQRLFILPDIVQFFNFRHHFLLFYSAEHCPDLTGQILRPNSSLATTSSRPDATHWWARNELAFSLSSGQEALRTTSCSTSQRNQFLDKLVPVELAKWGKLIHQKLFQLFTLTIAISYAPFWVWCSTH